MNAFATILHDADFCVVGGGMAGLCAAVAAARHGARVVLMQDRPVLGGNASSEIRMWISGAHGENNRETGILEEAALENQYRNPLKNYSIWDSVLYGLARAEPNMELLLNCSCLDAETIDGRIQSVCGWQTTTQRFHTVRAKVFADCSGDSVLAPLTGATFRLGREAKTTFGETIAPDAADCKTMGMSCLMQAREMTEDMPFIAPGWAEKITAEQLRHRVPNLQDIEENFWYLELGGDHDSIGDTELLRDELVALAYGLWDYLKNDPSQKEKNKRWALDWVGMLPGKRESRRYIGPHTLTQGDIDSGGVFEDVVAYGGWTMDDHHPSGFRTQEPPNVFHPAPSPYGIPYRCLYSANIQNLFFAGRNISASHAAFSSSRVMATCALCGQAVGTAAALAAKSGVAPKDVPVRVLQERLMDDDCYLPGLRRPIPPLTAHARLIADGKNAEALRDGIDRPRESDTHLWTGTSVRYVFDRPAYVGSLRMVFDSDLMRQTCTPQERTIYNCMFCNRHLSMHPAHPPQTLIRRFRVLGEFADGRREVLVEEGDNHLRLRRYPVDRDGLIAVTLEPLETWGLGEYRLFAFEASARGLKGATSS